MTNSPILPGANGGDDEGGNPPISLKSALEERYLAYALSTIMHRALPDVRDGLKPVHRRVLYAMRELRLAPDSPFTKSAKVVGEVMGNYHPHGDQAIYDALVRLAQDFAQRYPLVDGQGNFGNIDGDNAAAMRYTESRLTAVAALLLEDIDADTVDFRETYDGKGQEPAVLPANFPNLLANGSSGIAVGMATSIPPHNAAELCDAALYLIDHPGADTNALVALVPGPDFPTGGVLVDDHATITEAYRTGRGSFRVRARWAVEDLGRGGWQIVVTEIPYQVQKSRLIERIAELIENKRAPLLGDVRDESAEDVRIVLEPKARTVEPVVLMESLYKLTELEARIPLNMNVLTRGQVPNVIGLKQVLREWLDHRKVVLVRRSQHRLKAIEHRLEVLDGYLIAYLNIDEVIRIIREEDEPKPVMMARFSLTDVQAEAILNMRLRALRKLEEFEIRTEHQKLSDERAALIALLADNAKQWATISGEIRKTRELFGKNTPLGKRRTGFDSVADVDVNLTEAMIEKAPVTIVLSDKGWIRAMRGHLETAEGLSFKADDSLKAMVTAQTTDKLVLFASNGKFFTLGADKLPGGRGHGEPVRLLIDLEQEHDILGVFVHQTGRKLLIASRDGYGFVALEDDLVAMTKKGKQVLNLAEGDRAARVVAATGDTVAVIGENRKMLIFPASELAELARGRGTRLQKFREGGLADVKLFTAADGLTWRDGSGRTNTIKDVAEWQGARGAAGKPVPKGFSRSGTFGEPAL